MYSLLLSKLEDDNVASILSHYQHCTKAFSFNFSSLCHCGMFRGVAPDIGMVTHKKGRLKLKQFLISP